MNRFLISLAAIIFCVAFSYTADARKKADDSLFSSYTVTGTGNNAAADGSYLVKVNITTKDPKLPDADIVRCALHGVLFHGFKGSNNHFERPLAGKPSVETENSEYFNTFFDGEARSYGEVVPSTRAVTKTDKKRYVVTAVVEVHKDQLRRALQDAGVIRDLNSAF